MQNRNFIGSRAAAQEKLATSPGWGGSASASPSANRIGPATASNRRIVASPVGRTQQAKKSRTDA
ncbi:MAG: hypothetical protein QFF03_05265 [Pseudomonadota bacterium]|nr:hypothetical protein [Pseudomonadota bacterium]